METQLERETSDLSTTSARADCLVLLLGKARVCYLGFLCLCTRAAFWFFFGIPLQVRPVEEFFTSCVSTSLLLKAVRDARGPAGPRSPVHSPSAFPRTFTLRRSVRLLGPRVVISRGGAGVFVYSSAVHFVFLSVKAFSVAMFSNFLVLNGIDTFYGFFPGCVEGPL